MKLRQYPGLNRRRVIVDTTRAPWEETGSPGVTRQVLYASEDHPEEIFVLRMTPGSEFSLSAGRPGIEVFVLDGTIQDDNGLRTAGTWIRRPGGTAYDVSTGDGADLYVKVGHLGAFVKAA